MSDGAGRLKRPDVGGTANWHGARFELRLGVQLGVWMMLGHGAGLAPGPIAKAQIQAPETVDDWVVTFDLGDRWAIQAKGGRTGLSWDPDSPFGKAIRQLHRAAVDGQIRLGPEL